jgi:hypothetical protein
MFNFCSGGHKKRKNKKQRKQKKNKKTTDEQLIDDFMGTDFKNGKL